MGFEVGSFKLCCIQRQQSYVRKGESNVNRKFKKKKHTQVFYFKKTNIFSKRADVFSNKNQICKF